LISSRAQGLRAFSHGFSENRTPDFLETIMRNNVQQQSGRWTGQDARDYREDGRHPKYKDHGRIAGC
jgi:hypothetical protein